jgi:hypothetical protein
MWEYEGSVVQRLARRWRSLELGARRRNEVCEPRRSRHRRRAYVCPRTNLAHGYADQSRGIARQQTDRFATARSSEAGWRST